ncbi:hypothetical protein GCM10020219_053630 [Nonomuraea dietziae]
MGGRLPSFVGGPLKKTLYGRATCRTGGEHHCLDGQQPGASRHEDESEDQGGDGRAEAQHSRVGTHRGMLLKGRMGADRNVRARDRPQAARQSAVDTRQKSTARRFVSSSVVGFMDHDTTRRLAFCHFSSGS